MNDLTSLIGIPPFDYTLYDENCGQEWKSWLGSFQWYIKSNHIEDDQDKFVKLLHLASRKVQELYETLKGDDVSSDGKGPLAEKYVAHLTEYESALVKLNEFFLPKQNTSYERHVFRQIQQEKGEKFGIFLMRLRKQAERCGFGVNIEDHIKDQIIEKCQSVILRRDLLKLGNADLNKVIQVAKAFEAVSEQEKSFGKNYEVHHSLEKVYNIEAKSKPKSFINKSIECTRCGFTGHQSFEDKCPAKGKRCNTCGGRDHFSRKCKTKLKLSMSEDSCSTTKKRLPTEDVSSNEKKPKLQESVRYVWDDDGYVF